MEELIEAAREVLSHRVGGLPARGWLKDNDASRAALARLNVAVRDAAGDFDPLNYLAATTYAESQR